MSGTWASGWATGDVVTAAEMTKGVGAIYDTTLGIASASIDVTPIVGTYAHLIFELTGRGDAAATNVSVWVRYNNDSGANYDAQSVAGVAAAASAVESVAATIGIVGAIPAATAPASVFGTVRCDIPGYAGTIGQKSGVSQSALKTANASGGLTSYAYAHWWRSTAAINRITLLPSSGNFIIGTRLTIYAMGA